MELSQYSADFMKRTLAISMKDGEKFNPGQDRTVQSLTNWTPEQEEKYQKSIERNAVHAEKALGIPRDVWIDATRRLRAQFGYEKMFEALFMMGLTIGWVERGEQRAPAEKKGAKR